MNIRLYLWKGREGSRHVRGKEERKERCRRVGREVDVKPVLVERRQRSESYRK
jgi:hypothetical protein